MRGSLSRQITDAFRRLLPYKSQRGYQQDLPKERLYDILREVYSRRKDLLIELLPYLL
jgi:hypothetical protein